MAPLKIEHRTGVQAPAEVIWDILADLPRWAEWNPLYPQAEGQLKIGTPLTLQLALPGQPVQTIAPTVVDWVPNEQILWRLSAARGWLKTLRFIEIETLSEEACILSNGEFFHGLLAGPAVKRIGRGAIRQGFEALNLALKARAEAAHAARRDRAA